MIGGVKCSKLFLVILLLFSVGLVQSYSLSQEEKETLPLLQKQDLIEIILVMDQGLSNLETSLIERQKELSVKETEINEIKALLKTQKELYQKSYEMQKNLLDKNNTLTVWLYIAGGAILTETVYIMGGLTGQ